MADLSTRNFSVFEQLLQTTQEGFWHIDNVSKTIDVNPAMCRILGLERGQVIGRSIYDFVDSVNKDVFLKEIEARKAGKTGGYEISLRRSDGVNVPCINNASPILDNDGGKIGSIGLWTDISKTKNYRNLIEQSNQGVVILGDDASILFANKAIATIFGFDSAKELLSRSFAVDMVAPHERNRVCALHQKPHDKENVSNIFEYAALRRDGSIIQVQENFQRIEWNERPAVEARITDVSKRYETEQALQENEALLRAVFENSPSAIVLKDLEGRYQFVNNSFCSWLGLKPDEMIGKTADAFFPPDTAHRGADQDRQILQSGKGLEWEGELPVAANKRRTFHFNKFPVSQADGKISSIGLIGTDITEQKQADDAARASEERFRHFAESAADWFWEMDENLRFTFISSSIERAHGISAKWYYGKTREDLLGQNYDRKLWAQHLKALQAHRAFRDFTYLRVGDDVEPRWLRTSGKPVFDTDGTFLGYRGTGTDVTALMAREVAIVESERTLREILENSPIGVTIIAHTEAHGQVEAKRVFANAALAELFGASSREGIIAEDISKTWCDLDQLQFANEATKKGIDLVDFETKRRRLDGTEIWVSINTRNLQFDNQDCVMVWHFDVTERKESDAMLQQTTALLRSILDHMPALISLKDLQGHYLMANTGFAEFHGKNVNEIIGLTVFDLDLDESHARAVAAQDQSVVDAGTIQIEERSKPSPTGELERRVTKFPTFDSNGLVNGIGTVSVDIGSQRAIEDQLRQAQKMEAVGQLTGGVAHDFNNLLGVVIGNLDFLDELLESDGDQRELIATALQAALQGAELTNRLLAFSRRQALSPKILDLNALVSGMMDLLKRTLGETVRIRTSASPELKLVEIDPGQLETAFLNLAVNARQAMPEGGQLFIETSNVELDEKYAEQHEDLTPGSYAMLAVSDNGVGMSAGTLKHAFEPFFTTKEVGQGSGLGLSMVFGFAKQSRGHVSIYSEEGKGTSVKLYLPVSEEQTSTTFNKPTQDSFPMGSGETVLVVEDDANLRELAVKSVSSLGYNVIEAADGPAALAILDNNVHIDILFTDVVLPKGMNGVALSQTVVERRPSVRVLFTSGYTENAIVHNGVVDDGIDLVDKPYRRAELAHRLQLVLNET